MAEYQSPLNALMNQLPGVAMQLYQGEIQKQQIQEDREFKRMENALDRTLKLEEARKERELKKTEADLDRSASKTEFDASYNLDKEQFDELVRMNEEIIKKNNEQHKLFGLDLSDKEYELKDKERKEKFLKAQSIADKLLNEKYSYKNDESLFNLNATQFEHPIPGSLGFQFEPSINTTPLDTLFQPKGNTYTEFLEELKNSGADIEGIEGPLKEYYNQVTQDLGGSMLSSYMKNLEKEVLGETSNTANMFGLQFQPAGYKGLPTSTGKKSKYVQEQVANQLKNYLGQFNQQLLNAYLAKEYGPVQAELFGSPIGDMLSGTPDITTRK